MVNVVTQAGFGAVKVSQLFTVSEGIDAESASQLPHGYQHVPNVPHTRKSASYPIDSWSVV